MANGIDHIIFFGIESGQDALRQNRRSPFGAQAVACLDQVIACYLFARFFKLVAQDIGSIPAWCKSGLVGSGPMVWPLLLLGVFAFAVGAGVGLAWLLDKFRPVFHHSRSLAEITGLPVIGVVSLAWLEKHRLLLRHEYVKLAMAAGLLLITSAAVLLAHEQGAHLVQRLLG